MNDTPGIDRETAKAGARNADDAPRSSASLGSDRYQEEIDSLKSQLDYERETNRRLNAVLRSFEAERADVLSIRDYAIGTEQELGRLRFELQQSRDAEHALRTELVETHEHLAASIADSQAAHRRLADSSSGGLRRFSARLARRVGLR